MQKMEMEVFSTATNVPVLRFPGRNFPGSLIQGDSLSVLYGLTASIRGRARKSGDRQLIEDSQRLHELIHARLRVYEETLAQHGIQLPYVGGPLATNAGKYGI
jgi:hypothetical protein